MFLFWSLFQRRQERLFLLYFSLKNSLLGTVAIKQLFSNLTIFQIWCHRTWLLLLNIFDTTIDIEILLQFMKTLSYFIQSLFEGVPRRIQSLSLRMIFWCKQTLVFFHFLSSGCLALLRTLTLLLRCWLASFHK